jgi:aminopeptidase N
MSNNFAFRNVVQKESFYNLKRLDKIRKDFFGMTFLFLLSWHWPIAIGLGQNPLSGRITDGYLRQPGFDVLHYNLSLSVSDTNDVIHGQAIITVHRLARHDSTLTLDFASMNVAAIRIGEAAASFSPNAGQIEVFLPPRLDTLNLTIQYSGEPKDGLYIRKNKFNRRTFFADNWPDRARHWFPGIDHPADKATVEFHITAPDRYTVVANGRLEQERHNFNGTRTWTWRENAPIPTYCMVFGAAEFAVLHLGEAVNVPVSYYVFPGDAAVAKKSFGRTEQILHFFSEKIGPYPYEKLALVQSSTRFGGMENASAIFFAEAAMGSPRTEGTSAHEIAHQWFGDSVTEADWHHLWLSEGFATYFEALFYEHADGEAAFREEMRRLRDNYLDFARQKMTPILDTTVTNYFDLLNANNYPKAAWVLHTLRHLIGTESFWQGIRDYYKAYRDGNALTDDFRRIVERVSGEELGWFFDQWLRQPGHPEIKMEWRWLPNEKSVELTLQQIQAGTFFRLPLEIEIVSAGEKARHRIWMEKNEAQLKLPHNKRPERIVLDPEEKVLMTVVQ